MFPQRSIACVQKLNLTSILQPLQVFLLLALGGISATVLYVAFHPPLFLIIAAISLLAAIPLALSFTRQTFFVFLIIRNMADITSTRTFITIAGVDLNLSSVVSILFVAWGLWYFTRYWPLPKFSGNLTLFTFLVTGLLSVATSLDPVASAQEYLKFLNLAFALIIAYDITHTWDDARAIMRTVVLALLVPSIAGFVQLVSGTGVSVEISNRLYGTYGHPNTFAFALVAAICAAITLFISTPSQSKKMEAVAVPIIHSARHIIKTRLPYTTALAVFGTLLILTYTRAGWIGLGMVLVWYGMRFQARATVVIMTALILLWLSFPAARAIVYRMSAYDIGAHTLFRRISSDEEDTTSFAWRIRSWREVSVKFQELPLFGYGVGMFGRVRESTITYASDLRALEAHNDYLRLTIETGYVGAASYAFFLFVLLYKCAVGSFRNPVALRRRQYTIATGCVAAFIVMSITDNILRGTAVGWLFWTIAGCMMAMATHEHTSDQRIVSPVPIRAATPTNTRSVYDE